jgi:hypothetical protein
MCLGDGIDYPDPGRPGKQSCCFFFNAPGKVLFCCTRATASVRQRHKFGWRDEQSRRIVEAGFATAGASSKNRGADKALQAG